MKKKSPFLDFKSYLLYDKGKERGQKYGFYQYPHAVC